MIDEIELNESEVRAKYIDPAIKNSGWTEEIQIRREVSFTDGRININRGKMKRGVGKRADYILNYKSNLPLAIIEAKKSTLSLGAGIQQGKGYGEILDIPFIYSSNGKGFQEFDSFTGIERELKIDEFPTPEELWKRYIDGRVEIRDSRESIIPKSEIEKIISESYFYTQGRTPRYYQRVAINRTVEAVSSGQDRVLLVMATGTGKTYTAFQIIWRLWKARKKKRILFLADRNILVNQTMSNDFRHFGDKMTKISRTQINKTPEMSKVHEIYLGLYQSLTGTEEWEKVYKNYSKDFFDLIVIDECHRGSANEDSAWREILEYFSSATQVGMTATPKETSEASNTHYFGEPVYTYSLKQGIEDGFLAPYRVIRYGLDRDYTGFRPYKGQVDRYGNIIEDKEYNSKDFDRTMVLSERSKVVAKTIADYMKNEKDRFMKTIVFCENIEHAEDMRKALGNENSDLMQKNSKYVMKITGDDKEGKAQLDNFIDPKETYPVMATTSKLMTTGVDAKTCKLIVLDSNISSMTEFKQIIGRGTRIDEEYNKTWFTIMDFRGVSRLFADPDFDGEPLPDTDFNPEDAKGEESSDENGGDGENKPEDDGNIEYPTDENGNLDGENPTGSKGGEISDIKEKIRKFYVDGVEVKVINKVIQYLGEDGKLLVSSYEDYIRGKYKSLNEFLDVWNSLEKRKQILDELENKGIDFEELKKEIGQEIDIFDIICHLAFDTKPLSKKQRASKVKGSEYLKKYSGQAKEILEILLDKYADGNETIFNDVNTLKLPQFERFGNLPKIMRNFGNKDNYFQVIRELEREMYAY